MKSLLILGSGGHGQVVKEVAKACGYQNISFLDDNSSIAIGKIKDLKNFSEYSDVFVSIGIGNLREELLSLAKSLNFNIPTLIHPSAYVSESAQLGDGCIVEPKAVINSNVQIEEGCIISIGALVDHNVVIKKYSQVNTGCIVKTGSIINSYKKLEVGEVVYK